MTARPKAEMMERTKDNLASGDVLNPTEKTILASWRVGLEGYTVEKAKIEMVSVQGAIDAATDWLEALAVFIRSKK